MKEKTIGAVMEDETIIVPNDCILSIYSVDYGVRITYTFDGKDVSRVFIHSEKCRLMLSHILLKFDEDKRVIKIGVKENGMVTIFELSGENILELLDALFTSEYTRIERGLGV